MKKPSRPKKGLAIIIAPATKAPSGSGDKMINRIGGGKVKGRGAKK